MGKKIVIIGAGIAGLSAGCYARMNDFEAEIFESHTQPGGLCTSWARNGYTFDGCIHWLTGTSPADSFYHVWKELGAIRDDRIVDHDIFFRFRNPDGRMFNLYTNVDRLEQHLIALSPADTEAARHFCSLIRKFSGFKMPIGKAPELYNMLDIARLVVRLGPLMKDFKFCNSISIGDYAERFSDPFLRDSIAHVFNAPDLVLTSLVITLALLHNRAGGYPLGGSLEFARGIERRFLDLGGGIHYRSRVCSIRCAAEPDGSERATGIVLEDGTEVDADYVISAADLRTTLYGMLDGRHIDPQHLDLLENVPVYPSMVQVSFGANMPLPDVEHPLSELVRLDSPLTIGGDRCDRYLVKDYRYDPALAPTGKNVVTCGFVSSNYDYWESLGKDRGAYEAEKKRITELSIELVEQLYPGFRRAVEVVDVATPITFNRYAGVWHGTFMTWMSTPDNAEKLRTVRKTVPDLANFYLSGMWVYPPGGLPSGAISSRNVVQMICRKERRRFTARSAHQPAAVH